jgi:hypothetical protein
MTTIRKIMEKDYANAVFAFVAANLICENVIFAILAIYFSVVSMLQSTDRCYDTHTYIGINMFNMYSLLKGLFGIIIAMLAIAA